MANLQPTYVQPPEQGQAMAGQNPNQSAPPQGMAALQEKMLDPEFSKWFNTLGDAEKQQVLQRLSTDYAGNNNIANEQLAIADQLRNTPSAEGRQAGRTYVAANPLEHVVSAYKQRQGLTQQDEALARKKELSDMQTQGLQEVMATQLRSGGN